ncbi:TolC family protein [Gloeobacter kilaueensis]|uniref:Outer membrane efflux protein n=1 Tax=Gloeobacter kilaueensis (strain ATCC BAA-2537 / CCAP 1431/1 / ULC 316 / JS1) TaxID=1183438 RepID=U5QMW1_GLOK1|nr:TolC family protein [Gloeobacter kilaueensis]AGY59010.1 outer membrane efflux protein [Gloeobacter kilaueensis JS1]
MRIRSAALLLAVSLSTAWAAHAQNAPTGPDATPTGSGAADLAGPPAQVQRPPIPANPVELRVQNTVSLRLRDAINIALANSTQLLAARYAVEQALAGKFQAQAGLYPTINLNTSYTYSQLPQNTIQRVLINQSTANTPTFNPSQFQQTGTGSVFSSLGVTTGNAIVTATPGSNPLSLALTGAVPAGSAVATVSSGQVPAFNNAQAQALATAFTTATSSSNIGSLFLSESSVVQGSINVNWVVYSSGQVGSAILAAEENLKAATLNYETTRQNVINTVIGSYYDLQTADGNVEIGTASVKSAQASLRDAQAQERAGTGTHFAVLQAQVQLANSVQQNLNALNQRVVNERNLARLLNYDDPTEIKANEPIEQVGDWKLGLNESIQRALTQRTELAYQDTLRRQAKANEAVNYAQYGPQVSLFATGAFYDNMLDQVVGIYTGYSVGAQIQWQLFDGGAAYANAAQFVATARIAEVNYRDTYNTVRYSVETSISTLETARQQIQTANDAVVSATEALRLARRRFESGVGTQTDVITADRDLTQARVNQLTAVIGYNRALVAIQRAVGSL